MVNKLLISALASIIVAPLTVNAQCATNVNGGSSTNMFTMVRNNSNPIAASKDLNTIVFIHRNNVNAFGGNSGQLRYDISTNGGSSWTNNQGILNPATGVTARYPNVVLHNPPGNTSPSNASFGFLAAVVNGNYWNGYVTGTQKIGAGVSGETYNQPNPNSLIAGSLVKGAPGVYWAIDCSSDGTNETGSVLVYKGVWNGTTHINWSTNNVLSPGFNLNYNGIPYTGDMNIAFDPSGTFGWISIVGHLNSGPSSFNIYPIFYKTTNGGNTWSGPITLNFNQFNCITSNLYTTPAITIGADLTVDAYGNPHFLAVVANGNGNYGIDYDDWHHVMDITQKNGLWTAYDIANVKNSPEQFVGSTSTVFQMISPQIARSADGKKIFFTWTDNSFYTLGDPNFAPDLFGRALDVTKNQITNIKDFTSCNGSVSGSIYFPHIAEEVLEPSSGTYMVAVAYAAFTSGDPDQVANMKFLNNVTFSNTDFNGSVPSLVLNLSPSGTISLCQGSTANLSVSGNFPQISWNNGSSQSSIVVSNPGTYVVAARSGCTLGADSVVVRSLTMQPQVAGGPPCSGSAVTLSVSGNAGGYTWTPGNLTGPSVTVFPTGNTMYNVTGSGYNCTSAAGLAVGIIPSPSLTVFSNRPESCAGEEVTVQASGADVYKWNTGDSTTTISEYLQTTTSYTVTGTNIFGCSSTYTLTQIVNACVGLESLNAGSNLDLFPNPAKEILRTSSKQTLQVTLVNSLGQVVLQCTLSPENEFQMSTRNLPRGVYFAFMECETNRSTQKIILE